MKTKHLIVLLIFGLIYASCQQESFDDNSALGDLQAPKSMSYPSITNAREYQAITSSLPFIDSNGRPVYYQIVSVKNKAGILDENYLNVVSITNPTEGSQNIPNYGGANGYDSKYINTTNAGVINIAENNVYGPGDYYFTIKATVKEGGKELSTTFEDALHLNIGPELVSAILYCPVTINLIVGEGKATAAADIPFGNPDVRFELVSPKDKLQVDATTGSFSLVPSYTVTAPEKLQPVVNVISNVSDEVVTFEEGFLTIWASNQPIEIDSPTTYFFYPSLAAVADDKGYSSVVIEQGDGVKNNKIARSLAADEIASDARAAAGVTDMYYLQTNPVTNGPVTSVPHESWVVMDAQDLTPWSGCFKTTLTFYLKNTLLEYLPDGRTPSDMEIYISDSYSGNVTTTSWTQINDILTCEIDDNGDVFIGTPYPGDQTGPDPDGRKNPSRNAQGVWTKYELDLQPYLSQTSFTLAFKYATYFNGVLTPGTGEGRSANFQLSDVYFKAKEL